MKVLLVAVNAKYIHSNLAVYDLKAYTENIPVEVELAEYTIPSAFHSDKSPNTTRNCIVVTPFPNGYSGLIIPLLDKGINSFLEIFYGVCVVFANRIDDAVVDMVFEDNPAHTGNS